MPWRSASAVFLATAGLAVGRASGPDDALAMVQQEYRRGGGRVVPKPARTLEEAAEVFATPTGPPPLTSAVGYDLCMRTWLKSFYGLLRKKGDAALDDCCGMAQRQGILPGETWGEATEEEQRWWQESNCDMVVGAGDPDEPGGLSLCTPTDDDLAKMLPKEDPLPLSAVSLELTDGQGVGRDGPGCDEEDRAELNSSFVDSDKVLGTSDKCQEFYIIDKGVQWDKLVPCVSQIHGVTYACSKCYTNLLRDIGGDNVPENRGCLSTCMPLGACRETWDCGFFIDKCVQCVAPAFKDYNRCVGGPIFNAFTMRSVFEGMFLYQAR